MSIITRAIFEKTNIYYW